MDADDRRRGLERWMERWMAAGKGRDPGGNLAQVVDGLRG
jgi:hypothetical protein